jgi:hypothetical protein
MTDREEPEMSRKPSSDTKTKAARQRHSKNVHASDARKRELGLIRIAIWLPLDQAEAFKRDAKRAVDQYLNPVSTDLDQCLIPKPWKNPKPAFDRRQASLPF